VSDERADAELERAMQEVPRGALALTATGPAGRWKRRA